MAALENLVSLVLIAAAIYLGLKIIKNMIATAIMIIALIVILYLLGFIPPFLGPPPKLF